MRLLRLVAVFARVVIMNELHYRANLLFQLLQSLAALGTGMAVLGLVLSQIDEIRGWRAPHLIAVLGMFTILGGFIRMAIRPNLVRFMEDVQEGTLDHVLTKPVDAQVLVSIRACHVWHGVDVLIGAGLLAFAAAQLGEVSILNIAGFLVTLALSLAVVYAFLVMLATTAFMFISVDPIIELFEGVFQAGRWPVRIYPGWLQAGLTFVVPIGIAVTVPAEALTGRLSGASLLGFALLAGVLFGLARLVWRAGLRRYSGASS